MRRVPSPRALTVIRNLSQVGGAENENGYAACHVVRVRNLQRKNCPGWARSSSRCRPDIKTLITFGDSCRTSSTRSRCRHSWKSGWRTRQRSTSAKA